MVALKVEVREACQMRRATGPAWISVSDNHLLIGQCSNTHRVLPNLSLLETGGYGASGSFGGGMYIRMLLQHAIRTLGSHFSKAAQIASRIQLF